MDTESKFLKIYALFNSLADELIPPNEFHFKKYAKEYLNPLAQFLKPSDQQLDLNNMVGVIKFFNQTIEGGEIKFEGSLSDDASQRKYLLWVLELETLFLSSVFENLKELSTDAEIIELQQKIEPFLRDLHFHTPTEVNVPLVKLKNYIHERFQEIGPSIPENLYYWPYPTVYLIKLYELLLKADYIQPHNDFVESFKESGVSLKQRTVWKNEKQTSLFALLYLVYGKKKLYKSESISVIAHKLFKAKNSSSSSNSIKTAYEKFYERVHTNKKYLEKNHSQIIQIVSQLGLPK